jgi:Glycosyltransferases involved in cell wall biogenesis
VAEKEKEIMVSICCLTYNQEAYVRQALEGFVGQKTSFSYEILIHDDASTDRTAKIIREYALLYPDRVKPILQTENQYAKGLTNVSGTYNFPRAKGRYIAMCEGDDYWTDPYKLQKQVDFLESHPGCSLVFHSARIQVMGRAFTEQKMRPYKKSRKVTPEEIINKTSGYPTASLMFRTDMVKDLPEFYVKAPLADVPLQLMAAARGWAYYMDRPMCVYRLGGASSWTTLMKQGDYEKKQEQYYKEMGDMYRRYDQETKGRFHKVVGQAAARVYFLTRVNLKKYPEVLDPKYRRFYRELNLRVRFFIRFETLAPGLYKWALKLYHHGS